MYPREAIDFEEPYVSPYLRRRCRSIEEVLRQRYDYSDEVTPEQMAELRKLVAHLRLEDWPVVDGPALGNTEGNE